MKYKLKTLTKTLGAATLISLSTNAFAIADISTFDRISDYEDAYKMSGGSVGGSGGEYFTDMDDIKKYEPWIKPIQINVRSNKRLNQLTIAYGYTESAEEFLVEHGGGGGDSQETIHLADHQFIEKVKICSTDSKRSKGRVGKIHIWVTGQSEKTYGKADKGANSCSTYIAPDGWQIIGFDGREGSEVDRLSAIYAPKLKIEAEVEIGPLTSINNPSVVSVQGTIVANDTGGVIWSMFNYSNQSALSNQSSWQNTHTFKLGYSLTTSLEVGLTDGPWTAKGSISSTFSSEFINEFQYGKTNTETTTETTGDSQRIYVQPHKVTVSEISRLRSDAEAPLTIYYRNIYTDTVHRSDGIISQYELYDSSVIVFDIGEFVNNRIVLNEAYKNDAVYSCYEGKTAAEVNGCQSTY